MPTVAVETQYKKWYDERHKYALEWKEKTGGTVVGTFCTYVPEELLYAHNMLPVRILGSHEPQDLTEPHIFGMFCPFSRDALAQGLKGRYSYVDAIVLSHSCLHFRQTFTSWKMHLPIKWSYYLPMPNAVQSPHAKAAMVAEVAKFKNFLEEQTGKSITNNDLEKSINILNENRRLLRSAYEWRQKENPPITGTDAMYMAITSQFIDKEEHSRALKATLDEVKSRGENSSRECGIRLMTVGSENDDAAFFRMVESLGATVVVDEQCAGSRYFWNEAVPSGDPVTSIAHRYIERPPCPTKDYPERRRFPHILKLAQDYKVQGAIIMQEKFCDPHEGDNQALRAFLEANSIPILLLEFDSTNPLGPLRIRVEAFLETLREEELF